MMKNFLTLTSLASISLAAISAQPAQALLKSAQTTFDLESGEQLMFDWSYDDPDQAESDGLILLEELESWSFEFRNAAGGVEDAAVVVSSGIPVGSGSFLPFSFDFNLLTSSFSSFLVDGSNLRFSKFSFLNQIVVNGLAGPETEVIAETTTFSGGDGGGMVSTPEPSLMLGFITLGGVLLGSKRKTKS